MERFWLRMGWAVICLTLIYLIIHLVVAGVRANWGS